MPMKNYNIKITKEDEDMIKIIREEGCVNISQFIRKCLKEKYEEIQNGKEKVQ